jgi:hypothetical protein
VPKFRVTLRDPRPMCSPGERPINPFLIRDIFSMPRTTHRSRVWEVDAKDEADVRRLLDEARAAGIEQVRGFELWEIEAIEPPLECDHVFDGDRCVKCGGVA